jgi:uncharacterized membrane protein
MLIEFNVTVDDENTTEAFWKIGFVYLNDFDCRIHSYS